jgi:PPK2 family polyphosphate:nucleotide phosphotransferase
MQRFMVSPKKKIKLADFDPDDTHGIAGDKEEARARLLNLNRQLEVLQELLAAEHKHSLIVILQGMDTSGKDGVIRSVFEGVNPQGVRVASFKVPTPIEADHDYLWRHHLQTPGKGEIIIHNRSHYENVLVVRVHSLVPEKVWKKRYFQMAEFERLLVEEGTTVLKFFLHISKEEQKQRLLERLADPAKHWKFSPGDLKERALWDQYMVCYEDMLNKTSTSWAPWWIVPANKKWARDLLISTVLVNTLKGYKINPVSVLENAEQYRQELLNEDVKPAEKTP